MCHTKRGQMKYIVSIIYNDDTDECLVVSNTTTASEAIAQAEDHAITSGFDDWYIGEVTVQ